MASTKKSKIIKASIAVALITPTAFLLLFWYVLAPRFRLPLPQKLSHFFTSKTTEIFDSHGDSLDNLNRINASWLPIHEIPVVVQQSFIAVEDCDFYQHYGFSIRGIARATWNNLTQGRIAQGGSTISQQLSRLIFLNNNKTFIRKIRELSVALQLESQFSKSEILEAYLNLVFLGNHSYGIHAASWNFFGKRISEINLAEAALLAGLPQAPSRYAPHRHWKLAKKRQKHVLKRMIACHMIDKNQAQKAWNKKITIQREATKGKSQSQWYYEQALKQDLQQRLGQNPLPPGLKIFSAFDPKLNSALEEISDQFMLQLKPKQNLQIGYIAANPQNGQILSLRGGRSFVASQFDRSKNIRRPSQNLLLPLALASDFKKYGYIDFKTQPTSIFEPFQRIRDKRRWSDWSVLARRYHFSFPKGNLDHFKASPWHWTQAYIDFLANHSFCHLHFTQRILGPSGTIISDGFPCPAYVNGDMDQDKSAAVYAVALAMNNLNTQKKTPLKPWISFSSANNSDLWLAILSRKIILVVWIGNDHGRHLFRNTSTLQSSKKMQKMFNNSLTKLGYLNEQSGFVPHEGIAISKSPTDPRRRSQAQTRLTNLLF